jgi:hypothetical protein
MMKSEQVKEKLYPVLANYRAAKELLAQQIAEHLPKNAVVRVNSNSPSFHGIGIVQSFDHLTIDRALVLLENGNIWSYCVESIEEVLPTSEFPPWVTKHFLEKLDGDYDDYGLDDDSDGDVDNEANDCTCDGRLYPDPDCDIHGL